ncbi:hypothetical protein HAX54_004186 [Datura stramonium]|uniref:Uncharacterized protein n=1 Tax=Datura stramonium TaxID=4076 RepID=A0ABS8T6J3_DATST|nr:hypothetical protein [Datura stramonium]
MSLYWTTCPQFRCDQQIQSKQSCGKGLKGRVCSSCGDGIRIIEAIPGEEFHLGFFSFLKIMPRSRHYLILMHHRELFEPQKNERMKA